MSADTTFASLGVPAALTTVLAANGITTPFPIQAATLPDSLAGRDVLGRGRTGSGKTYAFVLPAGGPPRRQRRRAPRPRPAAGADPRPDPRAGRPRSTRRIAPLASGRRPAAPCTVFGGVGQDPQVRGLRARRRHRRRLPGPARGPHRARATRSLDAVEITVLDEADHMADLGFLPGRPAAARRRPRSDGQRLLFSATLDAGVDVLVKRFLHQPGHPQVDSAQSPVVDDDPPRAARAAPTTGCRCWSTSPPRPAARVVFTRTKHGAKKLARQLNAAGRAGRRAARQPLPERPHPQPGRLLRRRGAARWSPPTSPPAASTSTTSRWSSTPTRRSSTRPTCTAPAAPPAPAPRAPSSR